VVVLLVEDDQAVREVLAVALEEAGMRVEQVGSRAEALRIASRVRPDLVVLDRQLPDGDGWQVVDELRRRTGAADAIVIAMTAHVGLTTAERALIAGCEAFFEKPCEPARVIERAKELLAARTTSTSVRRRIKLRDS
jgi:DNA-binding response OmpR family regulator